MTLDEVLAKHEIDPHTIMCGAWQDAGTQPLDKGQLR